MRIAIPGIIILLAIILAGCQPPVAIKPAGGIEAEPETVFDWPNRIPSAVHGKEVFEQHCASCHGEEGTGTVLTSRAAGSETGPAAVPAAGPVPEKIGRVPNFDNAVYMRPKIPKDLYLSITDPNLMPAAHGEGKIDQKKLTRQEKWNAIFYIWSLSTRDEDSTPDKPTFETIKKAGALFVKNCSVCHGTKGLGDGNLSHGLDPKPRNFNEFAWMYDKNSDRFFRSISNGRDWTAMPSWKDTLTERERWWIIKYLWSFIYEHPDKQVANHSIAAE